ncbi:hypothetical protein Pcinc_013596 [Petrolisthes cinctipes]|uniref:Uncharacterized protein n=1 Tax=Petrolisthes cinctipes TaxID=88211 RepID=A0AAE1KSL1_PETCI|nr:hypothetical protein Pcinc_013596 [Petrolisthes cinctipes]
MSYLAAMDWIVGSRDALQEAKRVVSEEYSVVGLVEHMDLSLTLMETLVPRYFTGAVRIYKKIKKVDNNININHQKPQVSLAIKKKLMRMFSNDMDLYNFVEQRLFQQRPTVKQFYCQQVYSYLRSSTETQVELAALEEVAMSDSETEDNPDTSPPPPPHC